MAAFPMTPHFTTHTGIAENGCEAAATCHRAPVSWAEILVSRLLLEGPRSQQSQVRNLASDSTKVRSGASVAVFFRGQSRQWIWAMPPAQPTLGRAAHN